MKNVIMSPRSSCLNGRNLNPVLSDFKAQDFCTLQDHCLKEGDLEKHLGFLPS